jgi:hypothetical protein
MRLFFALCLIVFLAFSGYHLTFRRIRLPLSARNFYLKGSEFLFLGLLLGPAFWNLLDPNTLRGLEPFSALLLGWVGLLFGFQFEIGKLRRFPLEYFAAALIQSAITLALVYLGSACALSVLLPSGVPFQIAVALTLAAAAAGTAQTGLALLPPKTVIRNRSTVRLLSYISGIDGIVPIAIFALAFILDRPAPSASLAGLPPLPGGVLLYLSGGGLLILIYVLLLSRRREESDLLLVVIGMAIIASGAASVVGFSPLICNVIVGACIVNLSREKERIFQVLLNVEKPVYLLLLVFLGAHWHFDSLWLPLLAVGFCLSRMLGKWLGGAAVCRFMPSLGQRQRHLGLGLLDTGGLPLAILFDCQRRFPSQLTNEAVSVVLLAVILNELMAPYLMGHLLGEGKNARLEA